MTLKTGAALALLGTAAALILSGASARRTVSKVTQGALLVRDRNGLPGAECPLKHTDVKAEITGFLARVHVTQEFENTAGDTIEAVYVFPLPPMAGAEAVLIAVLPQTRSAQLFRQSLSQVFMFFWLAVLGCALFAIFAYMAPPA